MPPPFPAGSGLQVSSILQVPLFPARASVCRPSRECPLPAEWRAELVCWMRIACRMAPHRSFKLLRVIQVSGLHCSALPSLTEIGGQKRVAPGEARSGSGPPAETGRAKSALPHGEDSTRFGEPILAAPGSGLCCFGAWYCAQFLRRVCANYVPPRGNCSHCAPLDPSRLCISCTGAQGMQSS